ncbi:MAG: 4-alpha-glucanotransferase [Planctomycetaceae bacterium]|nr:MAG: 4-alpha-glucanotransferase [Planctomycetaceae bacterium]
MLRHRASGILLHPTSLCTPFGMGDIGPEAERFIAWLAAARQHYWQVLPLVPTGGEWSPYQSPSAFAGNPWLISPEKLRRDGLITENDLSEAVLPDSGALSHIDFPTVIARKSRLLELASQRLLRLPTSSALLQAYEAFKQHHASWLEDHALFMVLREKHGHRSWLEWDQYVDAQRRPLPGVRDLLQSELEQQRSWQFLFWHQWQELRCFAQAHGVKIIGDLPIYVSHDSADVWANRSWFQLTETGHPQRVAGVPPDYFSATGQLWNNPLYAWDALRADGYRWWIRRLQTTLEQVDIVRLDHFRGFEAYWSVPAGETTAIHGEWVPGPADDLLHALQTACADAQGDLPIIAEDLGMITPAVHALRQRFGLPGMVVLQFRLPGAAHDPPFRLDEFDPNTVVYTGTHDNDTVRGWFVTDILPYPERLEALRRITPCDPHDISWEFLEIAWKCSAHLAIAPLQDVLSLGSEARMNTPGTSGPQFLNWRWKMQPGMLTPDVQNRLKVLTLATGRATD